VTYLRFSHSVSAYDDAFYAFSSEANQF
jgi:hypothetical protein